MAYESLAEDVLSSSNNASRRRCRCARCASTATATRATWLWTEKGPHFVDLDDCMTGPAVQDPVDAAFGRAAGNARSAGRHRRGLPGVRRLDQHETALIEPLRTLRIMHYAGWLARRWDDPAFPRAFPWFQEPKYWEQHVLNLREQVAAMEEPFS